MLAFVSVCYFAVVGGGFYGFSVVMPAMIDAQGWSRTEASLGFSIMMLTFGLNAPVIAILISKIKTQRTLLLGGCFVVVGSIALYFSSSILSFYVGSFLLGIGLSMSSVVPGGHLIAQWFSRRRSLSMGIFMACGGLGAFVFAPFFSSLITTTGDWRIVWVYVGAIGAAVGILGFLIVRERPVVMGQFVDGIDPEAVDAANAATEKPAKVYKSSINWTHGEAFKTRVFWLMLFASWIAMTGNTVVTSQVVLHLTDIGVSQLVAAGALGIVGLVNTVGRFSGGALGDRIDPKLLMFVGLILEMAGIFVLIRAEQEALVYLFAVLFGLGFGLYLVAFTSLIANYFGAENYAKIYALLGLCYTVLTASGPILAGYAYDKLGSYDLPFYVILAFGFCASIAVLFMKPPVRKPIAT
ncbi:MAG: MFS transporter [Pseudomonadales bacterium]|nr:MFS transporter [Pseudomonadales bacterium]